MASTTAPRPFSPVLAIVSAARRRHDLSIAVRELPWAFTSFFAGSALLLLFGTRFLSALTLAFFGIVGTTIAAVRAYRYRTTDYRIAQLIDSRLQLHDSLSTAWYLLRQQTAPFYERAASSQIKAAESVAKNVDLQSALPMRLERIWLLPAGLLLLCCTLFVLRWEHSASLDLKRPLLPASIQSWLDRMAPEATEQTQAGRKQQTSNQHEFPNLPGTRPAAEHPNPAAQDRQTSNNRGQLSNTQTDGQTPTSPRTSDPFAGAKQNEDEQNSALDRMKDALGGMASKLEQAMKPKEAVGPRKSSESQSSSGDKSSPDAQQESSEKNSQAKSGQSDKQGQANNSDSSSEAKAVEQKQPGQPGDASASNGEHGTDSQSGAGRNDGRKEMQDAAQLKAMGKLAEIIGKRSASVTGDMTVEKPSTGHQQLKTNYSNHLGTHTDEGGELHRDEIPPEYREFVRTYMQEVHQQPSPTRRTESQPQ